MAKGIKELTGLGELKLTPNNLMEVATENADVDGIYARKVKLDELEGYLINSENRADGETPPIKSAINVAETAAKTYARGKIDTGADLYADGDKLPSLDSGLKNKLAAEQVTNATVVVVLNKLFDWLNEEITRAIGQEGTESSTTLREAITNEENARRDADGDFELLPDFSLFDLNQDWGSGKKDITKSLIKAGMAMQKLNTSLRDYYGVKEDELNQTVAPFGNAKPMEVIAGFYSLLGSIAALPIAEYNAVSSGDTKVNVVNVLKWLYDRATANPIEPIFFNEGRIALKYDGESLDVTDVGGVDTLQIADLGVTEGKLAYDAVTAAKLADDAVNTGNIINGAVTADKLDAGSLPLLDLLKLANPGEGEYKIVIDGHGGITLALIE